MYAFVADTNSKYYSVYHDTECILIGEVLRNSVEC